MSEKVKKAFKECGNCGKDAICDWCGYAPFDYVNEFIEKLQEENQRLRECVSLLGKEETPYKVHEHRDTLEERFHNLIIKARLCLSAIDKKL